MKKSGEINEESKADYIAHVSAEFKIPDGFYNDLSKKKKRDLVENLVETIYGDISKHNRHNEADSLGLWVEYDGKILENAMSVETINDMKTYGPDGINPVYEFFKMTIK